MFVLSVRPRQSKPSQISRRLAWLGSTQASWQSYWHLHLYHHHHRHHHTTTLPTSQTTAVATLITADAVAAATSSPAPAAAARYAHHLFLPPPQQLPIRCLRPTPTPPAHHVRSGWPPRFLLAPVPAPASAPAPAAARACACVCVCLCFCYPILSTSRPQLPTIPPNSPRTLLCSRGRPPFLSCRAS